MRFWLLDAIEEVVPGERLVAVKNVSYSEEYLQDHFPEFPVLPGVFMLEAATQAAAWLLRLSDPQAPAVIALKEAKNVKYGGFVSPGQSLRIEVSLIKHEDGLAAFKASGTIGEKSSLSGRLVLECYNLADTDPAMADADERLRGYFKRWLPAILKPQLLA
ncbi:MAG: 3-hydroxyacyl-ACP dehydratase FabZ family protein [Planctomycetota bacterium]